ncbi:MAG: DUF4342 domain-containing protein [Caldilineaceae bacterium]
MLNEEKVETPETPKSETSGEGAASSKGHSWAEEIEIASEQLVARVKELIAEGNVRRLIIRKPDGDVLLEVPLTAGVAVGGVFTVVAPVLAALGAMAALIARVKVEIIREG